MQLGADKEAKAVNGRTPLQFAKAAGKHEAVRALTQLGADVNALTDILYVSMVPLLIFFAFYVFKRLFGSARSASSRRSSPPAASRLRQPPRGRPARTATVDHTAATQQRARSEQQRQCRLTEALLEALRQLAAAPHDGNAIHSADAVSFCP
jgi:hypothetical protein